MNRISISVLSLFIFLSLSAFAQYVLSGAKPFPAELLNETGELSQIVDKIQKMNSSSLICPQDVATNSGSLCQFTNQCNVLDKNKNNINIYANPQGQLLPNFRLRMLQQELSHCGQRLGQQYVQSHPEMNAIDQYKNILAEAKKAKLDFFSFIAKHPRGARPENYDDHIYAELMKEASQEAINNTIADPENPGTPFTSSQVDKWLANLESHAGVKLSSGARARYIKYLTRIEEVDPEKSGQVHPLDKDPFWNPNLFSMVKEAGGERAVDENQHQLQIQVDRMDGIFKKTQQRVISVLKERKNGKNDGPIDNMISRIESIKFNVDDNLMMMKFNCPSPNAFYSPGDHRFTMCPQVMEMPDATLESIMAHELAHSVDPCTLTSPLFSLQAEYKEASIPAPPNEDFKPLKLKVPENRIAFASIDPEIAKMSLPGTYFKAQYSKILEGIPLSQNPFSSVIQCLQDPQGVSASLSDPEEVRPAIVKAIAELKNTGVKADDPRIKSYEETLANLSKVWKEQRACSILPGKRSKMQEAFADWMSSKVMSEEVKAAKSLPGGDLTARQIAFETGGFFTAMGCAGISPQASEDVKRALQKYKCDQGSSFIRDLDNIYGASDRADDVHPYSTVRIEKIFDAQPEIRSALGCGILPESSHAKACK